MKTRITLPLVALTLALSACSGAIDADEYGDDAFDGKADSARGGRFETFTGDDGQTYFHFLAANGEKVLQSEGYTTEASAAEGIETVRFNGAHAESYQLLQAQDGQWYFNLLAGNWEVIASSELYVSRSNAERAVATVVGLVQSAARSRAARTARFQVFRGLDGQYYFHLRAGNGEIVLQSEGYTRRASALAGSASVRANGPDAARYQVKDAANGQAYFVLMAANGQVIGVSETYASRSNAQRGATTVATLLQSESVADAR
jgi:uncharacterized protein YegP (UPF0339 family)